MKATRWNVEAAAAMARRARLNGPQPVPLWAGAVVPVHIVYEEGAWIGPFLAGALAGFVGSYLPGFITIIWRSL